MNKISHLLVLAPVVCLALSLPASGADKPISGRKVLWRDPVNVAQRRFMFLSKEPNIIFGANADSDTPTTHGAALLVFNPVSSECQCFVLPANGWTIGTLGKRYTYRDPLLVNSPIKVAFIRSGKVKAAGLGPGLGGITLDETQQGEIAVHYTSGTGNKLCADFTTPSITQDRPGTFLALNALPPFACAPEPAGCTPCVPPIVP